MNNTKSSMIDIKPKDSIKLDTVPLDKTYPEETVCTDIFINLGKSTEIKKKSNRLYLE